MLTGARWPLDDGMEQPLPRAVLVTDQVDPVAVPAKREDPVAVVFDIDLVGRRPALAAIDAGRMPWCPVFV